MFTDYGIFLMDKDRRSDVDDPQDSGRFQRTGSFRKVLPSRPSASVDSRLTMSMKMVGRPDVIEADKRKKSYAPYFLEYALLSEFAIFQKNEIQGIYISPADKDPLVWYGVLFLHDGPFKGGIFRFQVLFPVTFPDSQCPRIVFDDNIPHPAINPETRDLNVHAEFPEWKKTVNQVWHILQYVKSAFLNPETKSPSNETAALLLYEDPAEFNRRAQICVAASLDNLFVPPADDDPNYITFEPMSATEEAQMFV